MGDSRRFDVFASFVATQFPNKNLKIADVAGGKGYLALALREQGYRDITIIDPKRRLKKKVNHRATFLAIPFTETLDRRFDLVLGMHPDEATDHIIRYSVKHGSPFVVCPCCIKPSAVAYWGSAKFHLWIAHLKRMAVGFSIREYLLKMSGKNLVLVGEP